MRALFVLASIIALLAGAGCGKKYDFGDAGAEDMRSGGGDGGGGGGEDLSMSAADMTTVNRPCNVQKLDWAGDPAAHEAGSKAQVGITGGSAAAAETVMVTVQSFPKQAVMKATLNWAPRADCSGATEVVMRFDKEVGNNDQWVGPIPPQPAGTQVCFYMKLTSCGGMDVYVSNSSQNYRYTTK